MSDSACFCPSYVCIMAGEEAPSTVPYDHLLKILLIGDMGSDKRRLLQTYMGEEEFSDTTTLGKITLTETLFVQSDYS